MSGVRVEFDGLPELIRALRNNAGLAQPIRNALDDIGLKASSASKRAAPVGVAGKQRGSITYEVDKSPLPTFVKIGTIGSDRPSYAAYMEFGTGLVHDHPSWPRRPHIVRGGVLALWGKRKGVNPYVAAAAINRRGGLEPRRYLRGPFEANARQYVRILTQALREASFRG